jgi:hypothetical protein
MKKNLGNLNDGNKNYMMSMIKTKNIINTRPNLEEEEGPANGVSRVKWADD